MTYAGASMIESHHTYKAGSKEQKDLDYILFLPDDIDIKKKDYPLVLFLHGAGERGSNLELVKFHGIPKLISEGKTFPFITIAPQCPKEGYWDRPEYVSSLISLVKHVMGKYNVRSNQVCGTGLSMGGLGTLAISIEEPDLFSAIVPVCGGADLEKIDRLERLPIWLFHGDKDEVISVENSISIYEALEPKNKRVLLTIYEGVGHDSWTETYENQDVYEWLIKYTY